MTNPNTETKTMTVTLYEDSTGESWWTGTLDSFFQENEEFDALDRETIEAELLEGNEVRFGGGAEPLFIIRPEAR